MSEGELVKFSMEPRTLEEAMKYAEIIAKSDLVPKDYKGNPGNVLIAIQWGNEVGLKPLQALQNIAVVNGRPSLYGDAPLALVMDSGLLEDFREDFDDAHLIATCTAKRKGQPTVITYTFSADDAKKAGLWAKQNYQQYPKRMLKMRARGFVLRDGFPDVLKGIAIAEEQEDVEVAVEALPAPPAPPKRLSQQDTVDEVASWINLLASCETIDQLKANWDRLTEAGGYFESRTADERARLTVAKDTRKVQLVAGIPEKEPDAGAAG